MQRKHASHPFTLSIPLAAGGTGADLVGDSYVYNAFAGNSTTASGGGNVDAMQEWVIEASFVTYVALAGQITNFVSPRLAHRSAAGVMLNELRIVFSAAGVVTVAWVPVNLNVAAGAVTTGAGTGVLVVTTGTALPWALNNGDTLTFDRVSNNGTGLATPAMSLTGRIGVKGS